ncbi:amidase [Glycomyces buryatensis]|uniref:amidase n=1 Tax=Glycomyces buryatensis TaxID=2570927 RepID=UPI001456280A|nr:amidase [Glycomyces buryatensis]
MTDPFVPWIPVQAAPQSLEGPLSGLRLAVKDLFDVAGMPTGAGNPRWLETHEIPDRDAAAVARLRTAGAGLVGKTITDELAWSINGTNAHYGAPDNPAAPGRMSGGSSSGSASAVALGRADIGLGTDTGGSIRIPASYCGLYGLRPTHGRVPLTGTVDLAPSFDTAGILTRDAATLRLAGTVLLGTPEGTGQFAAHAPHREPAPITGLLVPEDIWARQLPETREALMPAIEGSGLDIDRTPLFDHPDELEHARQDYAVLQAREAIETHRAWIEAAEPKFGPGVGRRFASGPKITDDMVAAATDHRRRLTELMNERISGGTALAIPAAPGPAPKLDAEPDREAIMRLTCVSGLTRAPAVALPVGVIAGLPIGLQLVAAPGADESLLALADSARFIPVR